MTVRDTEVAIIGGGAAGIAAGKRLHEAGVACRIVEARTRLGGRAWTCEDRAGHPVDLGCGWLHSADRNPWVPIVEAQGRTIDKTSPPWSRPSLPGVFAPGEQSAFNKAMGEFFERLSAAVAKGKDMPAADVLEPGNRWNNLITAVGTYISGTELQNMSALDFELYDDTEINWRVKEGYGTAIAAHGKDVPVEFDCPVTRIDHSGKRVKIVTAKGDITADKVIITLPTNVLAARADLFAPTLPEKTRAASRLPLGLADKLFLSLDRAEEFEPGGRLFGSTDRAGTGTYHMRPFSRPLIECFYAGQCARDLEAGGERAFFNFAVEELSHHLGSDFAKRVKPSLIHPWGNDPYARGSYSYAVPGAAYERGMLAAPVDQRLFFAGEACSTHDFSTAHGAYPPASPQPIKCSLPASGIRKRSSPHDCDDFIFALDPTLCQHAIPAGEDFMSSIFVFDAYGTLFDVHAAIGRFRERAGPEADRMSDIWRTKQLEYTWTLTLAGHYTDFWTLTERALDYALARVPSVPASLKTGLLDAYFKLDAFPDARAALRALKAAGHKTGILSNGSPAMLDGAVANADIGNDLDAVLSVDVLKMFKPRPEVYALVTDHYKCAPRNVTFVSSNRWDVMASVSVGFSGLWVNRSKMPNEYLDFAPERIVPDLSSLAALR